MNNMRVLITNLVMLGRSGTESHVRDLALGLSRRGHTPIVYSPRLGEPSLELRAAGIAVTDDMNSVWPAPDLIHGHHNLPTMAALLHFTGTPAVFVCHDRLAWHDAPPRLGRIRRYVAVDCHCLERLVQEHAIPASQTLVIPNSVDLDRFKQREPLPLRPARALLFSNYANLHTHLNPVREACLRTGLQLDVIGSGVNNVRDHPEHVLGQYDLVFAKARCALEALATGAAVVLCGSEGSGPLVTLNQLEYLRRFNFGRRVLEQPVAAELLVEQINRYDASETARVTAWIRAEAGLDKMISEWLKVYEEVLAGNVAAPEMTPESESRAASDFLCSLEPHLFNVFAAADKIQHLEAQVQSQALELCRVREGRRRLTTRFFRGVRRRLQNLTKG
ncbi:MAG: hypothetical protein DMG06_25235 [Acidobacteria bacterium]|nr:MAG: hypothetical protein DMG06_25235 [Acidobacteriota bacterium]